MFFPKTNVDKSVHKSRVLPSGSNLHYILSVYTISLYTSYFDFLPSLFSKIHKVFSRKGAGEMHLHFVCTPSRLFMSTCLPVCLCVSLFVYQFSLLMFAWRRNLHLKLLGMHAMAIFSQVAGLLKYTLPVSVSTCTVTHQIMVAFGILFDVSE